MTASNVTDFDVSALPFEQRTVVLVYDMQNALYRIYHAINQSVNRRNAEGDEVGPAPDVVVDAFGRVLASLMTGLSAAESPVRHAARWGRVYPVYCWDGGGTSFRHVAYPEYKATRKPAPPALKASVALAQQRLTGDNHLRIIGWEADDVIATFVKRLRDSTWEDVPVALVSSDRDLLQLLAHPKVYQHVPLGGMKGWWAGDSFSIRFGFSPLWFPDHKALMGDATDNLPGVKGLGEKFATRLVQQYGPLESIFGEVPRTIEDARILKLLTPEHYAVAKQQRELTRLVETVPGVDIAGPLGFREG